MIEVAKMIGEKVSEDKWFWVKVLGEIGLAFLGFSSLALLIFGKGKIPFLNTKS